jgi:cobalt-zinc-cadmium efflux system outer membrane protein
MRIIAGCLLLVPLAGCASVNPKPAFDDVQKVVQDRTGQAAVWVKSDADAEAVQREARTLLARPLTADDAVRIAFLQNASLQATFEELGIGKADVAQATRIANPELALEAVPLSTGVTQGSLTQDVFNILMQPLRTRLAAVQFEQTKMRVGNRMLELAAETKEALYTLQAHQQLAGRLAIVLEINQAAAELAARQHTAGNINDLDLANQHAAYDATRAQLAQAQSEVRSDRERLNRLMGVWGADTAWTTSDRLPDMPEEEVPADHVEGLAIRQRLDVQAARFGVDLVGRALALRQKTRFFPVGLNVGVQTDRQFGEKRVWGPNLSVQLPIFDLGGASIARLEAQYRQSRRELDAIAVNARSEAREARDLVTSNRDRALFYRDVLLPQRVRILNLTLQHYNMMLKGVYDVLLARQNEVQTEREYVEVARDYWIARVRLERAVGGRLSSPGAGEATADSSQGAKQ